MDRFPRILAFFGGAAVAGAFALGPVGTWRAAAAKLPLRLRPAPASSSAAAASSAGVRFGRFEIDASQVRCACCESAVCGSAPNQWLAAEASLCRLERGPRKETARSFSSFADVSSHPVRAAEGFALAVLVDVTLPC